MYEAIVAEIVAEIFRIVLQYMYCIHGYPTCTLVHSPGLTPRLLEDYDLYSRPPTQPTLCG